MMMDGLRMKGKNKFLSDYELTYMCETIAQRRAKMCPCTCTSSKNFLRKPEKQTSVGSKTIDFQDNLKATAEYKTKSQTHCIKLEWDNELSRIYKDIFYIWRTVSDHMSDLQCVEVLQPSEGARL